VRMDPSHPNTRHFVRVIGEIWAEYVRTHSLEACEDLNRHVISSRAIRHQLFTAPRAVGQLTQHSMPAQHDE